MNLARLLLALVILSCLTGCESGRSLSTVQDEHTAYAVKGAEAKQIADEALVNYVPARNIDPTPQAGLVATGALSEGGKTQTISVTALPVSGVNSAGQIREGYGFVVKETGDVVNPLASQMVYGQVKRQAALAGEMLATAKPQQ